MSDSIKIGNFQICKATGVLGRIKYVTITIVDGPNKNEGGTFSEDDLERIIAKFYNDNF